MSPTRVSGSRKASGARSTTPNGVVNSRAKTGLEEEGEGVEPEVLRRKVKYEEMVEADARS